MRRIGIFGGTFNPPHNGHRNIAKTFAKAYDLEKVLIIPTYIPPHKVAPDLASGEDRLKMCELVFKDDVFEVSDIEVLRGGRSYTYITLEELHEVYEDTEFYFLVGDDMLLYLNNWAEPKRVLELCKLTSTIRSNECSVETLRDFAKTNYPEEYEAGRFEFFEIDPLAMSSTEIRTKLKNGESVDNFIEPETLSYIESRGLYR